MRGTWQSQSRALLKEEKAFVNPYRYRVRRYPGRILCLDDLDRERLSVLDSLQGVDEVFCELGSGSGRFLLEVAKRKPLSKCFGFERRYKRAFRTIEKAVRDSIDNVTVFCADAELMPEVFCQTRLSGIYINFPDPWDKRRWHKHRLLNEGFLRTCTSLLVKDGFISIKTDHYGYFTELTELLSRDMSLIVECATRDLHSSPFREGNIVTEFEALFLSQKLPICFMRIRRA